MEMNMFDAVIFDMDGLLIDTERLSLDAFCEACDRYGLGDQSAVFRRCIGVNKIAGELIIREGLSRIVDPLQFIETWNEMYLARTVNTKIPLKLGAIELLEHLRTLNIPTGVATSSSTKSATKKLTNTGIFNYFKVLVGGDQVSRSKPYPDIYLKAASLLGVSPGKCLALEDSENGVKAAVSAGMFTIQIPDLVEPSIELKALGHMIRSSLNEVKDHEFG